MNPEIGRYLEGRPLPTIKLLRVLHDLALGAGSDTVVWIEGRELVFGRGEARRNRGFVRVLGQEHTAVLSFPRGAELFDPAKRASGPPRSETRIVLRDPMDVDPYVRRMVAEAYRLDAPPEPPPPPPEPPPDEYEY